MNIATSPLQPAPPPPMKAVSLPFYADRLGFPLPESIAAIPSMMSPRERMLLFTLAACEYRGDGVIMDAGIFCGASTACFAAGIRANLAAEAIQARWRKPVRSYEYGRVNPNMIPFFARHGVEGEWAVGESFEPMLRANLRPFNKLVKLTMGDIAMAKWDGSPIEIMFLDVLKSTTIQFAVMREFMPSLIEGGLLIQQDYFFDGLPFLRILQEHMADHFEYLGEVQSTAVFRLVKPIEPTMFLRDPLAKIPVPRKLELLDQARDRSIDPARRLMCDLGKVRFLATLGRSAEALVLLQSLPETYPAQYGEGQLPRIATAVRIATNAVARG